MPEIGSVSNAAGGPPKHRTVPGRVAYGLLRVLWLIVRSPLTLIRVVGVGRRGMLRILWWVMPNSSVARDQRFQRVFLSRFLSDSGAQALLYGALIAVVREEESSFYAALVGIAALVPPAFFSVPGGAIADVLPRRVALAGAYTVQAGLCFVVPMLLGTGFVAILFLVFAVMTIGQLSGPTESAIIPLVADEEQMASANSLVNLASFLGAGFGQAILAPILVVLFDVTPVIYVSGVFLLLAAVRMVDRRPAASGAGAARSRPPVAGRVGFRWLLEQPGVASLMVLAALVATANVVVTTLAPRYVQEVLELDPAQAVYVFAPAMVGLLVSLLISPLAIRAFTERRWAILGFVITSAALLGLGLVEQVQPIVDRLNPLRFTELLPVELGEDMRTASALAVPLGFGIGSATAAVGTYINRRVPEALQGRAFALQTMLKSGLAIPPLLALGWAASLVGVQAVLVASPFVLLLLAIGAQRRLRPTARPTFSTSPARA